ncbi:MAG: hypothetical protein COV66_07055 [Nitrospinae bacterium CG11_big_fil_rev_8_21_14_0_20_45_15]|nr:MAG: hypothetical protein COV66_07055 [Nitrospinae bacterium CG11_big_fil_rev_8_21_14_0_20_45_15]
MHFSLSLFCAKTVKAYEQDNYFGSLNKNTEIAMNIARTEKINKKTQTDPAIPYMLDATLQSSLSSVLLSARGNPYKLLSQTLLEKLNSQFGYTLEEPKSKEIDKSNPTPEAFATDMALMMSDFLVKFSRNRDDRNSQYCANEFLVQALHAVNEGFCETKEILSTFGSIPSQFSNDMEKIYEHLMGKIDLALNGSQLGKPVS